MRPLYRAQSGVRFLKEAELWSNWSRDPTLTPPTHPEKQRAEPRAGNRQRVARFLLVRDTRRKETGASAAVTPTALFQPGAGSRRADLWHNERKARRVSETVLQLNRRAKSQERQLEGSSAGRSARARAQGLLWHNGTVTRGDMFLLFLPALCTQI